MASVNQKVPATHVTHEGAPAKRITPEQQLRRSVMTCMLWENTFYECGTSIADRIANIIKEISPLTVFDIAVEAREKMKLRHVPLLMARQCARLDSHKHIVSNLLCRVVQRPDELTEFLAIYWKEGRETLSAQVKKGLARAFTKFSEYQLAKYNRDGAVKLRDVLFLSHPKPKDSEQQKMWDRLVRGELKTPDTWEVNLSAGKNKKESWERLLSENKLGALALLRNLRNMKDVGVKEKLVTGALEIMKTERVLPFRFISAAKYAPQWEEYLEKAMYKCLKDRKKLSGKTILLIDVSGSMTWAISNKSELQRWEAAAGLAILIKEICEDVSIFAFDTSFYTLPPRRGFALRDSLQIVGGGGTYLGGAVQKVNAEKTYDRLIVLTDEQSCDTIPRPKTKGYIINVSSDKNGVGYGKWLHIDGWSEAIIDYIMEYEKEYS